MISMGLNIILEILTSWVTTYRRIHAREKSMNGAVGGLIVITTSSLL